MKKKILSLLIITYIFAFMLSGCEKSPDPAADVRPPEPEEAVSTGVTVLPGTGGGKDGEQSRADAPQSETDGDGDETQIPEPASEDARLAFVTDWAAGMTDAELAGQMVFCVCPAGGAAALIEEIRPGGIILLSNSIDGKTPETLSNELSGYQAQSAVPLLIAVDEEGGTVCRVSSHSAFRASRFRSPRAILEDGGRDALRADTLEKAELLTGLGINVNFAPVCDLAQDPDSFMYARALPGDAAEAASYVVEMVRVMQENGLGAVLKHFPGYGENGDTHTSVVTDTREAEVFYSEDLLPFLSGTIAGSRGVMVSHNIVTAFDGVLPASLSPAMLAVLREMLGDDVVAMTDDLEMDAVASRWTLSKAACMAIEAGEDMVLCGNGRTAAQALAQALEDGSLSRERAEEAVRRILLWKAELGLIELPE